MITLTLKEELRKRVVKDFLDILTLMELKRNPMSGHDLISSIWKKFDVQLSPGTVYGLLYNLEREGYIKNVGNGKKKVYTLTEKGMQVAMAINDMRQEIRELTGKCFGMS